MRTRRKLHPLFAALVLMGVLAACSLPGRDPEIVVVQLPTSTSQPTPPLQVERDPCLLGDWVMPAASLDLFVASLFPASTVLHIPSGQLNMSFADGAFTYSGDYVIRVDTGPGAYSETQTTFTTAGAYGTPQEGQLLFDVSSSEAHMLVCSAYKDGVLYTVPCDPNGMFNLLPPSEGPYRCSSNLLEIDVPAPSGSVVTMFFER
jgi:hypothetical protein